MEKEKKEKGKIRAERKRKDKKRYKQKLNEINKIGIKEEYKDRLRIDSTRGMIKEQKVWEQLALPDQSSVCTETKEKKTKKLIR